MPETDVIIARTNVIILSEFARLTAISYLLVVVVVVFFVCLVLFCFLQITFSESFSLGYSKYLSRIVRIVTTESVIEVC